jgi:formylglycine-generating enzyme required for sulfatase activity
MSLSQLLEFYEAQIVALASRGPKFRLGSMKRLVGLMTGIRKCAAASVLLLVGLAAWGQALVIRNIAQTNVWVRFQIESELGISNQILFTTNLSRSNWTVLTNLAVPQTPYWFTDPAIPLSLQRFYRVAYLPPTTNLVFLPAGSFQMGNCMNPNEGSTNELPLHTVYVSGFYMDRCDVTKALWDNVCNWATNNGYSFDYGAGGKSGNHPAQSLTWYDAVKWCNARSEKEGRVPAYYTNAAKTMVYRTGTNDLQASFVNWTNGYRLPTEAEWEKAARGAASGQRFPWGNTISWSQANYKADPAVYAYDVNPANGYHPAFTNNGMPYTSPAGYFSPNEYGLYDMSGNVWQWCWDWYGLYSSGPQSDPCGPALGLSRVYRGGCWFSVPINCRAADRAYGYPAGRNVDIGFRCVLPPGQ